MLNDHQFARLLEFMNYSWSGYRKVRKGVKKRLARHMQELGCRNIDDYLERLKADLAEQKECERRMTVSISRFFRDRRLWQIIGKRVLPEIINQGHDPVKVWVAGCACGEEVYSLRILWEEWIAGCEAPPALAVIATDLNPQYLERAKRGIYSRGSLREVDEERRVKWFDHVKKEHYAVKPLLKQSVEWRQHDLLSADPPGTHFDLVFLRNNLLTYYPEEMIRAPLDRIISALSPWGFLLIGAKEKMPHCTRTRLSPYERCIYRAAIKTGCYSCS